MLLLLIAQRLPPVDLTTIVERPSIGIVDRPSDGIVERPSGGIVQRPDAKDAGVPW